MPREARTEARFRDFYERHFVAVLGFVRRRGASPEDAADAVAESFLVAWRRWDDLPGSDMERAWLIGAARKVVSNQRRGNARRSSLVEALGREIRASGPPPSAVPDSWAGNTMEELDEADREILQLAYWEDLKPPEIAAVLRCSQNAARIRLHRARKRFRARLDARSDSGRPALEAAVRPEEAS